MSSLEGLHRILLFLWLVTTCGLFVSGDASDWVSVSYIVQEARRSGSTSGPSTELALDSIIRGADQLGGKGPWSITNDKSIFPPSNDPHDYLSWAPYHWPDCRWCTTQSQTKAKIKDTDDAEQPAEDQSPAEASSVVPVGYGGDQQALGSPAHRRSYRPRHAAHRRRMRKVHSRHRERRDSFTAARTRGRPNTARSKPTTSSVESSALSVAPVPTTNTGGLSATVTKSATQAPGTAVATKSTCTPSPTTSMAPSATWTTCPYIGRDGKVNPIVRTLSGPGAINTMAQYVLYSSIAFATNRSVKYSQGVVRAIDTFFLNPDTNMRPNVNFGQLVRGPGPDGRRGTFTGVLDIRGIVKVINGIFILKSTGSSEWDNAKDLAMRGWVQSYAQWLQESDIGSITASRPNNHVTFYVAQLAASKYYTGDKPGAVAVLQHFFKNEFRDQVAASGEQPFEGVRAKPMHYRAFNLEALIMNAKLGDALGQDFWSAKSKYGATIQNALDYAMVRDPKGEETDDLLPHIAAVAAAYGDPEGKYKAFLDKKMAGYERRPYWFYNQPSAFAKAPSSAKAKRKAKKTKKAKRSEVKGSLLDEADESDGDDSDEADNPEVPVGAKPTIPFTCPDAFKDTAKVEIDNGMFVTCEQLRPLYETDASVPAGVVH